MGAVVIKQMEFISVQLSSFQYSIQPGLLKPPWLVIQYIDRSYNSAKACFNSMQNHFWYLTERFDVLCLTNDELQEDIRQAVALQLYKTPRPEMPFPYNLGKVTPQIVVDGHTKLLSEIVGPESWFLFDKLKLTMLEMEWIKKNPSNWELFSEFLKCKSFSYCKT